MTFVICILIGALSSSWHVNPPESSPYVVQVDIEVPDQAAEFTNPSGLTIRVNVETRLNIRIRILSLGSERVPVDVDHPEDLLEIRKKSGSVPSVRFGDLERTALGVYETSYEFGDSGEFLLIVLPDIGDRSLLPAESTDRVTVVVDRSSTSPLVTSQTEIVAAILLSALVGTLVFTATRGRRRTKAASPPVPHDTWWNSP